MQMRCEMTTSPVAQMTRRKSIIVRHCRNSSLDIPLLGSIQKNGYMRIQKSVTIEICLGTPPTYACTDVIKTIYSM